MTRALAALSLLVLACDGDVAPAVRVDLQAESGALPGRYRAVLASAGTVSAVSCPGTERAAALSCGSDGVLVARAALPAELTFKVPGFRFRTVSLAAADAQRGEASVVVSPLPPFERTAAFATGFGEEERALAFEELGVSATDELGPSQSLKFYLEGLPDAPRVYFQDTRRFPRHIDFVTNGLGRPIPPAEFEARTYHGVDRTAMAGTVIARPEVTLAEDEEHDALTAPVTLEFFPSDDLTPEQALVAHRLLEERMLFLSRDGAAERLVYVPAAAPQEAQLAEEAQAFRDKDALFSAHSALYAGIGRQILNPGLAYGTLRRLSPEELSHTIVSRRDILLLTRLPNDLPLVGGTITEELQTPLAHVNLAAHARGTPNIALPGASSDPRLAPHLDTLVRFEVTADDFSVTLATLEEAEAFWQGAEHEPLVPESDSDFEGLPGFEELGFSDAVRVGVKAANLAELRGLVGEQAPDGFAVPFSAFDRYMTDNVVADDACEGARGACVDDGRESALCDDVAALCAGGAAAEESFYAYFQRLLGADVVTEDTALREAALAGFRFLVENGVVDPDFAAALDARVTEVFGDLQVRLRSSTNVEDLADFNGAGLYESFSAGGSEERRPSSRIRLVWASTWTFPAFEERALWNVNESAVRMGVAVNQAFDDEAANGVLITENVSAPSSPGFYVNVQRGENAVANPEGGLVAEALTIVPGIDDRPTAVVQRYSTLSPEQSLLTGAEVEALYDLGARVEAHFAPLYGTVPNAAAFDLEWKLLGAERTLIVKQVRPYAGR